MKQTTLATMATTKRVHEEGHSDTPLRSSQEKRPDLKGTPVKSNRSARNSLKATGTHQSPLSMDDNEMNEVSDGHIEPGNRKGDSLIDVQDKPTREEGSPLAFHKYLSPKVQETSSPITTVNGTVHSSLLDSPLPARNLRGQYATRSRINHSKQEKAPDLVSHRYDSEIVRPTNTIDLTSTSLSTSQGTISNDLAIFNPYSKDSKPIALELKAPPQESIVRDKSVVIKKSNTIGVLVQQDIPTVTNKESELENEVQLLGSTLSSTTNPVLLESPTRFSDSSLSRLPVQLVLGIPTITPTTTLKYSNREDSPLSDSLESGKESESTIHQTPSLPSEDVPTTHEIYTYIYNKLKQMITLDTVIDDKYIQILAWITNTYISHEELPVLTQRNLWLNICNKIISDVKCASNIKGYDYKSFVSASGMTIPKPGNKKQRDRLLIASATKYKRNLTVIEQIGGEILFSMLESCEEFIPSNCLSFPTKIQIIQDALKAVQASSTNILLCSSDRYTHEFYKFLLHLDNMEGRSNAKPCSESEVEFIAMNLHGIQLGASAGAKKKTRFTMQDSSLVSASLGETNTAKEAWKKWNEKQTSNDNIPSPKVTKGKNTTLLQPVQVKHTFITRFQLKLKIHPTNAHSNFMKFFFYDTTNN